MFIKVTTFDEAEPLYINLRFVLAFQAKGDHAVLHIVDPTNGKEWLEVRETVEQLKTTDRCFAKF